MRDASLLVGGVLPVRRPPVSAPARFAEAARGTPISEGTAMVADNNLVPLGPLCSLRSAGVDAPRQGVIGVGSIPVLGMADPRLTTLASPEEEAGRGAICVLRQLLSDLVAKNAAGQDLSAMLPARSATARPPSASTERCLYRRAGLQPRRRG
jgi:DNA-binding LacI/PurR family transcriptional regulator